MKEQRVKDVQIKMCVACKGCASKRMLTRFAVTGRWVIVARGINVLGRGACICLDIDRFSIVMNLYRFMRALKKLPIVSREKFLLESLKNLNLGCKLEGKRRDG